MQNKFNPEGRSWRKTKVDAGEIETGKIETGEQEEFCGPLQALWQQ